MRMLKFCARILKRKDEMYTQFLNDQKRVFPKTLVVNIKTQKDDLYTQISDCISNEKYDFI